MRNNSIRLGAPLLAVFTAIVPASARETRTVVLDGRSVRVLTIGMNHPADRPLVVFESGAGTGLDTWSTVLPQVGQFARAFAYDRAGFGLSESDGQAPTARHVAHGRQRPVEPRQTLSWRLWAPTGAHRTDGQPFKSVD